MFRKTFALVAAALCASAASANYMKVVNLKAPYLSATSPSTPYTNVLTLKPNTVYDYQGAANGNIDQYLVVQCPPAKAVKGMKAAEKAFLAYITLSTGDDNVDLQVIDAKTGYDLAEMFAPAEEGYGSALTIVCVNGRITNNYNYEA